jgi:hypothetical protein
LRRSLVKRTRAALGLILYGLSSPPQGARVNAARPFTPMIWGGTQGYPQNLANITALRFPLAWALIPYGKP